MKNRRKIIASLLIAISVFLIDNGAIAYSEQIDSLEIVSSQSNDAIQEMNLPSIGIGDNWFIAQNSDGIQRLYVGDPAYTYMNITSGISQTNILLMNNDNNAKGKFDTYKFIDNKWVADGNSIDNFATNDNWQVLSKGKEFNPYGYNAIIKSYPRGENTVPGVDLNHSDFVISHNYGKFMLYCAPSQYDGVWVAENNACDYYYRQDPSSSKYYELDCWQYNPNEDTWSYQGKVSRTVGDAKEIFCTVGTFLYGDGRPAQANLRSFLTKDTSSDSPSIEIGSNWFVAKTSTETSKLYLGNASYDYMSVTSGINEMQVSLKNSNNTATGSFISYKLVNEQWVSDGNIVEKDNWEVISKSKNFVPYGFNTIIKSYPNGEGDVLGVNPSYSNFAITHTNGKIMLYCAPIQYDGVWVASSNYGCDYFYRPSISSSEYFELDCWKYNSNENTWLYQGKTARTAGYTDEIFCTVGNFVYADGRPGHLDVRSFLTNQISEAPPVEIGENWFTVGNGDEIPKLYIGSPSYDYMKVTTGIDNINVFLTNENNNSTGKFVVNEFINHKWIGKGSFSGNFDAKDNCQVSSKGKNFIPYGFNTTIKSYPSDEGNVLGVNPSYSNFAITHTNGKIMLYCAPIQYDGVWVASSNYGCDYFYRPSISSSEYFELDCWKYNSNENTWLYQGKTDRTAGYANEIFCTVGNFVYADGRPGHLDVRSFLTNQYLKFVETRFGNDGIDACSGNYSKNYIDFELTSSNIDLNLNRTYNSLSNKGGILGKGWTFGFESKVENYVYDPNLYIVYLPNGSVKTFTKQENGNFKANDSRSTLTYENNKYIYKNKEQIQYEYGANNKLEKVIDRFGNVTQISYNNDDLITKITDEAQREYIFTYDGSLLIKITDPIGREVKYHYTNGMLTSVENVNGTETKFEYNDKNVLTQIKLKDSQNNVVELNKMEYVAEGVDTGKISKLTNEAGNITTYTYDKFSKLTTETDSNARVRQIYYDEAGYPTRIVEADNSETLITYTMEDGTNKYGEELSRKDIYGNLTSYERDGKGNVTKQTNPDNSMKQYFYNRKNNVIKEIDELGNVTETIYDNDEVTVLKVVKPIDGTTPYSSNQDQNLYEITSYTYYLPEQTNGIKGLIHTKNDREGKVTYQYDTYGNIRTQTDGENNVTTYSNNILGWKLSEQINENGYMTTYEYNNNGDITKTIKAGNTIQETAYNYQNKPTKVIDGNGNYEINEYDIAGNITKYIDKEGNVTNYTYDLYGNVITETKANGAIYQYNYDNLNRATSIYYKTNDTAPYQLLQDIAYQTSFGKRIVTTRTYTNEEQYKTKIETFDERNNLIKEQNDSRIKEITYQKNGLKAIEKLENGKHIYYYYTNTNHVAKKYEQISAQEYIGTIYEYDTLGRIVKEKIGKEKVALEAMPTSYKETNYEYNSNGKVIRETTSSNEEHQYEYDAYSNTIKESIKISDTQDSEYSILSYEYNHLNKKIKENKNGLVTSYEYDGNGNVIKSIDPENHVTTYRYNKQDKLTNTKLENESIKTTQYDVMGNVIIETDANGNETKYEYDKLNNIIKVIDANNGTTSYKNDLIGRVLEETTPNNAQTNNKTIYVYDNYDNVKEKNITYVQNGETITISTKYEYDDANNVIKKIDPDNKIATYEYNKLNKLTKKIDENGNITTYQYDYALNVIEETNAKGNIISYEYDERGNLISKKLKETANSEPVCLENSIYDLMNNKVSSFDAKGNRTTYTYDKNKNLLVETLPSAYEKTYKYNGNGQVTKITDNMNKETCYQYDVYGNVIKETVQANKNGQITQSITQYTEYDKNGNVTKQIDENGNSTTYQYDKLNNKIAEINAKGQKTTYTYDKNGNLLKETNFVGNSKTYVYDPIDRLIHKKNELGETIEQLEYDKNSRQIKSIDAIGKQIQYVYDNVGNLIQEIDQENHAQIYEYDSLNNKITSKDKKGKVTTYEYNYAKKLTKVTNPLNEVTKYEYDANNNLVKVIDAKNQETRYEYDASNNEISTTDSLGKTESKTYFMDGTLSSMTTKNGITIQYARDIHGRLVKETNGKEQIAYEYDNKENIIKITKGTTQTIREYDQLDRVVVKTENGLQSQYTYDIVNAETGRIAEKTIDSNHNEVTKEYDKVGRLYQVINENDITTYSYHSDGTTKEITYSNGVTEAYTYYPDKTLLKLINKNGEQVQEYGYEYDENNNITKKTDEKGITSYTYDNLNRITTIQTPSNTTVYEYDPAGNRTKEIVGANVKEYSYNAKNQLTKIVEKENNVPTKQTTYTYDNNGNQIEVKENGQLVESNVYNARNELIEVAKGENTASYAYNGEGKRIAKQVGQEITKFVYEGDRVILELDGSNNEKAVNIYGLALISREAGSDKGYYLYNGHGDVETIVSTNKTVLNTYYYDEYGNIKEETGEFDNPYTYAGYYYDKETKSYYLQSRYYNPEIGRFISEDTFRGNPEDPLSLNYYTYAHNNPLRYNDPDGHFIREILDGIEYVGKRVGAAAQAAVEIVYDIGKSAFDLGYEIGNFIKTGDGSTLAQMPKNVVQGIGNNFATTFNWDNFKNYWNPDTSYTELKDYSKSVIQTGATVYSGVKIVQSVAKAVGRVTSPTTTTYYNNTAESIVSNKPTIKGVSKAKANYTGNVSDKITKYNKINLQKTINKVENINPLQNVKYTAKVKKQMGNKSDKFHSFPKSVDGFGQYGKKTELIGGDGISRTKVQISGSYNNQKGIFEYIIEPNNTSNHRIFIPNK